MMTRMLRRFSVAFILLATAFLPWMGCLRSEDRVLLRYDAHDDRFFYLNLHQHFVGDHLADGQALYQRWRNRAHVIELPVPGWVCLDMRGGVIRTGADRVVALDLNNPAGSSSEYKGIALLDTVKVSPGRFFCTRDQGLCYYDQVEVPGKTVDRWLSDLIVALRPELQDAVQKERQRRRNGGQRVEWAELRKAVDSIPAVAAGEAPAPDQKAGMSFPEGLLRVIEEESLGRFEQGIDNGRFALTRHRQVFCLSIPLNAKDAKELARLFKETRVKQREAAEKVKNQPCWVGEEIYNAIDVVNEPDGTVNMAVDALRLYGIIDRAGAYFQKQSDVANTQPSATGFRVEDVLRRRNVPIDANTRVETIIDQFEKGKLESYPPAEAITPGEGLIGMLPRPTAADLAEIHTGVTSEEDLEKLLGDSDQHSRYASHPVPANQDPNHPTWTFGAGTLWVTLKNGRVAEWKLDPAPTTRP